VMQACGIKVTRNPARWQDAEGNSEVGRSASEQSRQETGAGEPVSSRSPARLICSTQIASVLNANAFFIRGHL